MTKVLRFTSNVSKSIASNNVFPITKCSANRTVSSGTYYREKETFNSAHSTVDSSEIKLFSTMKDWWNINGPMKPLHSMNTIRIPFIRDGLVSCSEDRKSIQPLKDKLILDVGCGGGILSEALARLGAQVTGIDATKDLIDIASEHSHYDPKIAYNKPMYYHTTVEEHALDRKDFYHGVVASEVIEHVTNKELFVKSCVEALKPGGRIFFTTPNRTRISQFASICVAEYVLNLLPKGTHQYSKFITPNELTFLLERNDCLVEAVYGLFYHFLSNTWEFVKPQQLMFALQAVKHQN